MENFNCSEELCKNCEEREPPKHKEEHGNPQSIRIVAEPEGGDEYLICMMCEES